MTASWYSAGKENKCVQINCTRQYPLPSAPPPWKNIPNTVPKPFKNQEKMITRGIRRATSRNLGGLGGSWGSKGERVLQKNTIFLRNSLQVGVQIEAVFYDFPCFLDLFFGCVFGRLSDTIFAGFGVDFGGCSNCFLLRFSMTLQVH